MIIGLTNSLVQPRGGGGGTPAPFSLDQLPVGALLTDFDPAHGVTLNGSTVSVWQDQKGGVSLAQATAAAQPAFSASGWSTGLPSVTGDGTDDILTGPNIAYSTAWIMHVLERGPSNAAGASVSRELFEFGRAGDGLRIIVRGQRPSSDAGQTILQASAPGSTTSLASLSGGLAIGERAVVTQAIGSTGTALAKNGGALTARANTAGAGTIATTSLFGSAQATQRNQGAKYGRLIAVDPSQMVGGEAQAFNRYLLEGHLAWTYGLQGSLAAGHPFTARAPLASDLKDYPLSIQLWGNSIGDRIAALIDEAAYLNVAGNGYRYWESGDGGATSTTIKGYFDTGVDNYPSSSGASLADIRNRITIIGEFFQNGPDSPTGNVATDGQTMRDELAAMVTALETAQDVAAGQGRICLLQRWISLNDSSAIGGSSRGEIETTNAWLDATYPNYVCKLSDYLCSLAAPGAAYDDPAQFARGQPPTAIFSDSVHPSQAVGSPICATFVTNWIKAKGWLPFPA